MRLNRVHRNIILIFILCITAPLSARNDKNILSGKYSLNQLADLIIQHKEWKPFPDITDRESWAKADPAILSGYISQAQKYLDYSWPGVPATKSLLIVRTGNRYEYEDISFEKRRVLGLLLLAEIAENKGRFIDQIVDGVWSICEESWWGVPAHLPKTDEYVGLMDTSQPFVDLFAAETGTYLAWVDYFLGDKLDEISPQIRKRIYNEVNYRLMQPLMNMHHEWMGVDKLGRAPNNWNPWICSNWINFVLLLEKDQNTRSQMIGHALKVLDEFVNPYPDDGGCDEGPSYWEAAAASLYDNIAMLNSATNNAFNYVFENPKIVNMGKYIYKAQISEKYFLNFADADPQPRIDGNLAFRFGQSIDDQDMMKFGAYYSKPGTRETRKFYYFRNLFDLFNQKEIENVSKELPLLKDVYFPDLQIAAGRDSEGDSNGFYVAAKGGHNQESHNHNDIGNYVIYYDGQPLIIDVGRGTYTAKTFGDRRYEIWSNCSDYHNLPTINGYNQLNGRQYTASDVTYNISESSFEFLMDISRAYDSHSGINSWNRKIKLIRGKEVIITDKVNLNKTESVAQHIMTNFPCTLVPEKGEVIIHYANSGVNKDFVIKYNSQQMKSNIEKVKLDSPEDVGIVKKWGDNIYRINFEVIAPRSSDEYVFKIKADK